MLQAIIKIANYTHFDIDTVMAMSISDCKEILELIEDEKRQANAVQLAIIDYQILLTQDPKKNSKQAQKIRKVLTENPKKNKVSNLDKIKEYVASSRSSIY